MEKLKYDSRKFGLYYWDILLEEHLIITIFCKNSLFIPRYIRIIKSLGTITLTFCLNAMFYTDDAMEKTAAVAQIDVSSILY